MARINLTESEKQDIRYMHNNFRDIGDNRLTEQEKEEMETRDKNIGDKLKKFFTQGPKLKLSWPKLPSWIRNHFIRKWNHLPGTKKYKEWGCTVSKCPQYDNLSDSEKKTA